MFVIVNNRLKNQFRKLKIYQKFRNRTWDNTTVPEIRLEGNWLKKLGFEIGKEIEIKQQKNKLTITLIEKKEKIATTPIPTKLRVIALKKAFIKKQ